MKIHDISMSIDKDMPYYPGETLLTVSPVYSIEQGDQGNSSKIIISSHCGTHIDPLSHIQENGYTADQEDLSKLIGSSIIIDLTESVTGKFVDRSHLEPYKDELSNKIVILKTLNSITNRKGEIDLDKTITISDAAAEFLSEMNITAIGLDSLTIGDKETHRIFLQNGIPIIEGLYLADIVSGVYTFICLPLKLIGLDGAPARAILIENMDIF